MLAAELVDLPQSFLAPWAALLVVHSTVYRTFSQGARQVAAAVAGVRAGLGGRQPARPRRRRRSAPSSAARTGCSAQSRWLEGEATTAAATALVVLTTGFSDDQHLLVDAALDTGIGIAVGLVVNFAVWPPLRRRTAIAAMDALDDRIGELLVDMADGLPRRAHATRSPTWLERHPDLDEDLDRAWALVRQARESARLNPRRSAASCATRSGSCCCAASSRRWPRPAALRGRSSDCLEEQREWHPAFRDGVRRGATPWWPGHRRRRRRRDPGLPLRLDQLVARLGGRIPRRSCGRCTAAWWSTSRNILDAMEEVAPRTRSTSRRCRSSCVAAYYRSIARLTQVE